MYMDLAETEKAPKTKALIISKHKYDPNSQEMKLFVNTPLIARKTSKNLNIMNNQRGKITKINTDTKEITVKMDDLIEVLLIKFDEINMMFYPPRKRSDISIPWIRDFITMAIVASNFN